jgi:hypothetical protein
VDALNPIMPDRNPTIPAHQFPAVQRVSPDAQREETHDDQHAEQEPEEENFEHLLDEVVGDDFPLPPGETVISDAVTVSADKRAVEAAAAEAAEAWDADEYRERRAGDDDDDHDPPVSHIDITA